MEGELDELVGSTEDSSVLPITSKPEEPPNRYLNFFTACLFAPILPDSSPLYPYPVPVIKTLKFLLLTNLLLPASYHLIHSNPTLDQDHTLNLPDIYTYFYPTINLDLIVLSLIGRIWHPSRPSVDNLSYILTSLTGTWFFSAVSTWKWSQHTLTLYSINCEWGTRLFILAGTVATVIVGIVVKHVIDAKRKGILKGRMLEIVVTFCCFLLPGLTTPSFHLHHWLEAWFLALHCNQPQRYSVYTQSFLLGGYLNGITAWGRGKVVGCQEVYFENAINYCDLVPRNWTNPNSMYDDDYVPPYEPKDWRDCKPDDWNG
mmetsp:Transcript_24514/g.51160  ORF Transcript_24514/g.51160 Transcript_24514/m.51160 type:complete len:316 (-) Transcript_24514:34-981(-)